MRKARKLKKSEIELRAWMLRNGILVTQMAADLEIHYSAITNWLRGRFPSQKIEDHFRERGCPEKLLYMREKEAA